MELRLSRKGAGLKPIGSINQTPFSERFIGLVTRPYFYSTDGCGYIDQWITYFKADVPGNDNPTIAGKVKNLRELGIPGCVYIRSLWNTPKHCLPVPTLPYLPELS